VQAYLAQDWKRPFRRRRGDTRKGSFMHRHPRLILLCIAILGAAVLGAAVLAGAAPAGANADLQPLQEQKLVATDGARADFLGYEVAYSGGVSVAGAPSRTVGANRGQGAAYVFSQSGELLTQDVLTASDGAVGDGFGVSVGIDGDTIVVGTPTHALPGRVVSGAVYVFVHSNGAWTQQAKLTAADGAAGDDFGTSVGISGDTVVVTAPRKQVGANECQGAVYVFARSGDTWTHQATLTASDGQADDYLGWSLDIDGDTVVTGAMDRQVGANAKQGACYVFVRSGSVWGQQAMLTAADGQADDRFGWTSAVDGDTAIVGASGANADVGGGYVFTRADGVWSQQAELTAPGLSPGAGFGSVAGIDGDLAVIGAQDQTIGGNSGQGAAYVYTRSGTTWSEPTQLVASDGGAGDSFGWWIEAEGNTALIAAPFSTVDGRWGQGAAYLYVPSEGPQAVVGGPAGAWERRPANLRFMAIPSQGGAPVAATQYWIDGITHMWTPASKLRVTAQGVTRVQVRAVDVNGTPGPVVTRTVRVDSRRPRVQARPAAGAAGSIARLHYRVLDPRPGCGHALVRLVVSDASGRVLTRSSTRPATTNAWHTVGIRTRALPAGTYRVALRAMDAAGNFQRGLTVTTLQVR